MRRKGAGERRLLSITTRDQLERILTIMLDEDEFLSNYGIRALSRRHRDQPYTLTLEGSEHSVHYEPGESSTGLFGGNSNWRGPIWLPVNYLLIQALRRFHEYYGADMKVECPSGSGRFGDLKDAADEISRRLVRIFRRDERGQRPVFGSNQLFRERTFIVRSFKDGDEPVTQFNGIGKGLHGQRVFFHTRQTEELSGRTQ
jgi:hypothetical protein